MSENYHNYTTATELTDAVIDALGIIEPDDDTYYEIINMALIYVKEV